MKIFGKVYASKFHQFISNYQKLVKEAKGKEACPLMKIAMPLAKNVLLPLGLTIAASAANTGTQKIIHRKESRTIKSSGTTLIISNEEIEYIRNYQISGRIKYIDKRCY